MPWMNITCGKCGAVADIDDFTRTPISGLLPPGRFQWPVCRHAFERRAAGGYRTYRAENGAMLTIPDRIELKPVASLL